LYPAHMASGRLFIPGELKIFHGGTPVLGPPARGATTIKCFVKNKKLKKKKNKMGHADQKSYNHYIIKKKQHTTNRLLYSFIEY
ncbi:hypothetical protein ACVGV7_12110, partial [Enterobacter intestinihominis]